MKTSQTWNQAFQDMRFDSQNEHLIVQQSASRSPQTSFFESHQITHNLSHANNSKEHTIHLTPNDNGAYLNERYEYSQMEHRSTQDIRGSDQGRNGEKNVRILDLSNGNNQLYVQGNTVTTHLQQQTKLSNAPQIVITQKINVPQGKIFPPFQQSNYSLIHQQPKQNNQYKTFENLRLTTQQSYAPSQKTLAMPHTQGFAPTNPVYLSHIVTEKPQGNIEGLQKRFSSPNPAVGIQMKTGVNSVVYNSQIPLERPTNRSEYFPKNVQGQGWRQKCAYMRQQFETIRARDLNQLQVAYSRISSLQQECLVIRQNYENLRHQYQQKVEEMQKLKQFPLKNGDSDLKKQFDQRGLLINLLKKENLHLKEQVDHINQYERQVKQLSESLAILQMEVEQKEMQINQIRSTNGNRGQYYLGRSNALSMESNKLVELEIQNARLMTELSSRNEAHQNELKLNSVRINELADRFQVTLHEKDQTIKNLQEKNSLLQSDLNKKESLFRNLRDELVENQRKKTIFNLQIPSPQLSTTASGIHQSKQRGERQEKDDNKRQMDNLRKHLFDIQRQNSILQQKNQEMQQRLLNYEQISQRRRNELQIMRRKLAEQQDELSELQQLREMLEKKNNQLADMRQILLEKEQHSSQYQFLSKENQKLKEITVRKNDELSNMSQRLYAAQKKLREKQTFNPRVDALEEEVEMLNKALNNHKMQIQRLNTNLQQANQMISQTQFDFEKERHRHEELESLLIKQELKSKQQEEELATAKQRCRLLERELEGMAGKIVDIQKQMQLRKRGENQAKQQLQVVKLQLQMKIDQLQSIQSQDRQLRLYKQRSYRQIEGLQCKQTNLLNRKNRELQLALVKCKEQEQTIKNQQQKISMLREKMTKHHDCQKNIENLTQRIATYELNALKSPHARKLFGEPSKQTHVFENHIIYKLKKQNENLRRITSRANIHQQSMSVKSRLGQFANHLNQTILGKQKSLLRMRSHEHLRPQKAQYKQFFDFKETLEEQVMTVKNLQKLQKQQITYYKDLNKSLEQRIEKLIQLNKQLKRSLSSVTNKDSQLKQFYQTQMQIEKERNQRLEKQIEKYKQQLRRSEHRSPLSHIRKQAIRTLYTSYKDYSQT